MAELLVMLTEPPDASVAIVLCIVTYVLRIARLRYLLNNIITGPLPKDWIAMPELSFM
jgi:hypothetical protein